MDGLLKRLIGLAGFFKSRQLTAEEVLVCVPADWITTLHGPNSLQARLHLHYKLANGEPGGGELYHLLQVLAARELIEVETRPWFNQRDGNWYRHQQCRRARGGTGLRDAARPMGRSVTT